MPNSGTYDTTLVTLSVLIAMVASYTALDLAARMRASSGWVRYAWWAAAAIAMGGGIWSMHFIAMLAFSLPSMKVSYGFTLTLISLALPIAVTGLGFLVSSRKSAGPLAVSASGLVMGVGIAAMHYTGMAAMRMAGDLRYDRLWVAISILISVGAATVAIWLASQTVGFVHRLVAAAIMGLAIAGMHYAAMQGAVFTPDAFDHVPAGASLPQTYLASSIAGATFLILLLALVAAMFDRQFANKAEREATALRESEERFRLLLSSLTDCAILMLDAKGYVANWNEGAERIKGYTQREIVGTHFSRFYCRDDQERGLPDEALRIAAHEGKFEEDGWRIRKDGTRFWASAVINSVRNSDGTVIGYAKVTRDLTERKRAEEALEEARVALFQSQKMEAVGQLTGGVAHDFNNLLMVMLGSLDLLRKRLPDDPKALRLVENAAEAAQRGVGLTRRMLAFARRQDLKLEAVDLPDLVHGMSDLLQSSMGPTVQVEAHFPIGLPPVLADANQLELALLNLAVNARDAMPDGGNITIGASAADAPPGLTKGQYVCLAVRDTGQGMDEATLARAQEPFFTTKGVGKGTGLGLSMVHGLAEQSSGRLVLKSQLGEGTTAEIWLPVAKNTSDQTKAADVSEAPSGPTRSLAVLVVDDDLLVLENAAAMLEDLGHRTVQAHSGEEAIEILDRDRKFDLVMTDHAMPNMTGAQLLDRVRGLQPGMSMILATGYAELSANEAVEVTRLIKPFNQDELARAVHAAVSGKTGSTSTVACAPSCVNTRAR
jgi:PAS domain S-box-containing protein